MSTNNRVALIVTSVAFVAVAATVTVLVLLSRGDASVSSSAGPEVQVEVFREDTRVLDEGSPGSVQVVEFLDFECEACGAFHPVTKELRERYGDKVTFAYRYFPLPSHGNSMNAALAVEAAAKQDRLEPMYDLMFETQAEWGERGGESQTARFRGYAEQLGLDLTQYDADVADPATRSRIESDVEDGLALGVQSTPTFFVDGERVDLTAYSDLDKAIDSALAAR